jgi:hypothetical protein
MLIGILMAGYIEAKSFHEEVSIKKIILIIACGIFAFYPIINIPDYINGPLRKMILTLFSYLIISVGTQLWLLIKN